MKFIVGILPSWFSPDISDIDIYNNLLQTKSGDIDWEDTLQNLNKIYGSISLNYAQINQHTLK